MTNDSASPQFKGHNVDGLMTRRLHEGCVTINLTDVYWKTVVITKVTDVKSLGILRDLVKEIKGRIVPQVLPLSMSRRYKACAFYIAILQSHFE